MYKMPKIKIGLVPTVRWPFGTEARLPQKKRYFEAFCGIDADVIEYVDIDDVVENGILNSPAKAEAVIEKFVKERVDGIFLEFLDFGNEESVAMVASALKVPTLVWGARDPAPTPEGARTSADIQCGIFAATKVLSSLGVLTRQNLKQWRKYAFVIVLILAALITPSDPFSMFVLAIPLYGLFEFSILLCRDIRQ